MFLSDVSDRPLSTTVSRYQRLTLSRRRGNAIRTSLASAGIIERVTIATRSGQVVLYQLTDLGRTICESSGIDCGPRPRASLEHRFWVNQAARHFEEQGYQVTREYPVKGNGAIDILAQRADERIAIEVETGRSDIKSNLKNIGQADVRRAILVATSGDAVTACRKSIDTLKQCKAPPVELITWLDIS